MRHAVPAASADARRHRHLQLARLGPRGRALSGVGEWDQRPAAAVRAGLEGW